MGWQLLSEHQFDMNPFWNIRISHAKLGILLKVYVERKRLTMASSFPVQYNALHLFEFFPDWNVLPIGSLHMYILKLKNFPTSAGIWLPASGLWGECSNYYTNSTNDTVINKACLKSQARSIFSPNLDCTENILLGDSLLSFCDFSIFQQEMKQN